jgi:methyltransferase
MVTAYYALLGLIAAERLLELRLARRNAKRALAEGGVEAGASHFRWMQLLHASFLLCCALEVSWFDRNFDPRLGIPMFALLLAAQALRYWTIATLGPRWTVRVIARPGLPVVTTGPYRWIRHPNYLAVVLEGLAIPLIYSAWLTALAFTILNAWLLRVRIAVEERTLVEHCAFAERLGDRPRIVPLRGAR